MNIVFTSVGSCSYIMDSFKTSTWKGNIAVNLYLSFGFEIIETTNNRVELIFNF